MTDDLIGTSEAARLLGKSPRTIHRLVTAGTLTPAMVAPGGAKGSYLLDRSAVQALVDGGVAVEGMDEEHFLDPEGGAPLASILNARLESENHDLEEKLRQSEENLRRLNAQYQQLVSQPPQADPRVASLATKLEAYLPQLTMTSTNVAYVSSAVSALESTVLAQTKVQERIASALERLVQQQETAQ